MTLEKTPPSNFWHLTYHSPITKNAQPYYKDCPHLTPTTSVVPVTIEAEEFMEGNILAALVVLTKKMLKKGIPGDMILTTYQYILL